MWPYWLLFLVPAFQAVTKLRQFAPALPGQGWPALWRIVFLLISLMIGMRHEVGGDWVNYIENIQKTAYFTLTEAVTNSVHGDPADAMLNWVGSYSGLGIYLVNCVYALFFTWGLLAFCRNQPRSWLALTVSVPYLITVVAMGYTRQGVAIGLAMLGLVALEKKSILKFLVWIALASTFHKSAVILVPLAVLGATRQRLLTMFWVCVTGVLLFILLLQEYVDHLVLNYIGVRYESSGAGIRIAMNALPATLFLLLRHRFQLSQAQRTFWIWMAWGALAFVVLFYISPSSTSVDRLALYWIPLQLFVWSRLPDAMGYPRSANTRWVYAVVGYSATVHFVWLFFADNAGSWLPYQFYPLVWLWE